MAAIASSAVTVLRSWEAMNTAGQFVEKVSDLSIVLSAQGGTLGDIPAATLGFAKVFCAEAINQNNGGGTANDYAGWVGVWSDYSGIFTANYGTGAPANYTGTLRVRVTGTPKR